MLFPLRRRCAHDGDVDGWNWNLEVTSEELVGLWVIGVPLALLFALLRTMARAGGRPRWGREAIGGAILLFAALMPVGWALLIACPGQSCDGDYFYGALIAAFIGLVGLVLCIVGAGFMIDGRRRDTRAGRRQRRLAKLPRTEG